MARPNGPTPGAGASARSKHPGRRRVALRIDPWLFVAALLAAIPIASLLQPGVPNTADGQVHVLRTFEALRLLRAGVFYPRWAPDFYLGYGYPFFNYYAPGVHMLAAWLAAAGLGVMRGVLAVQILGCLLYPTGAYLAARAVMPTSLPSATRAMAALVAAALYLYAPLRWRELFVQGNLSQWVALAWLPWCAWLLICAARQGGLGRTAAAGAALAALMYLHHPSAFLGYPLLGLFSLVIVLAAPRGPQARLAPRLAALCGAFLLGLAWSAPFWLPSLAELRYANLNAIAGGSFNAGLNLLPASELLALPALQDLAALNPPMPNSLGVAQVALAVPGLALGLWWLLRRGRGAAPDAAPGDARRAAPAVVWGLRQSGAALVGAAVLLGGCLALMLPAAAALWNALPLARFIAFPWRLLGPALLFAALLGGAGLALVPARFRTSAAGLALLLIPLSVAPYLFPRPFSHAGEPTVASIARYETTGGARGTASANEYLPAWVQDADPPDDMARDMLAGQPVDRLDLAGLPAGSQVTRLDSKLPGGRYRLQLPAPATVRWRTFYFPGWQALVDGRPAAITPEAPYGLITVALPAGTHDLEFVFGSTPARRAAGVAAGLALAVVAVAGMAALLRRRRAAPVAAPAQGATPAAAPGPVTRRQPVFALGGVIVIVALAKILVVEPRTSWWRVQSPAGQPAAMQHAVDAVFANGVELLGYDLTSDEVRQGDALAVRLYWRPLHGDLADARPFLHLDAATGDATWANLTKPMPADKPISSWVSGFYIVDDYRLTVPAGTPAVVAALRVGLLGEDGHLGALAAGGDQATLAGVRVRERAPLAAQLLPNHDRPYRLGAAVVLAGYEVQRSPDGAALDVTLYWQATAPVATDYTVFVHLQAAAGQMLAQVDSPPLHGWYPTSRWLPGQVIADSYRLALPAGAQPARLAVGLYTAADGQRAAVLNAAGATLPNNEVTLPLP